MSYLLDKTCAKGPIASWETTAMPLAARPSWYYASNKTKQGPVTLEQLGQLLESGQLQPSDMVWQEGTAKWVPASSIEYPAAQPPAGMSRPLPPALAKLATAPMERPPQEPYRVKHRIQQDRASVYAEPNWNSHVIVELVAGDEIELGKVQKVR